MSQNPFQSNRAPVVHKSGLPMAPDANVLIPYKEESDRPSMNLKKQRQQLLFAFSFLLMLGLLIVAGQMAMKPRMMASEKATAVQPDQGR